jgi:mannose-6-phosphate isomerase-like protein (cupin superfamily)
MAEPDRKKIEKKWKSRGFSFGLWVDPPGQTWEDYVHDTDELLIIAEGKLELEIDNKVSHPSIGEEVFIPAGAHHSVRNIGGTTAHWYYGYKR